MSETYLGRFTLPDTAVDFTVDDATYGAEAVALTTARYFIADASDGAGQFVEHIETQFGLTTNYKKIVCRFDYTTGKVSIFRDTNDDDVADGDAFTISWTDSDLRDLLGFTADLSGANTYTATNEARYVWRPDVGLSHYPLQINRLWSPSSSTLVHTAKDGTISTVPGTTTYSARLRYSLLSAARVRLPAAGAPPWAPLEQFWLDCISLGEIVRIFPDDTATTSSDYVSAYLMRESGAPIGDFDQWVRRYFQGPDVDTYWDLEMLARKAV